MLRYLNIVSGQRTSVLCSYLEGNSAAALSHLVTVRVSVSSDTCTDFDVLTLRASLIRTFAQRNADFLLEDAGSRYRFLSTEPQLILDFQCVVDFSRQA